MRDDLAVISKNVTANAETALLSNHSVGQIGPTAEEYGARGVRLKEPCFDKGLRREKTMFKALLFHFIVHRKYVNNPNCPIMLGARNRGEIRCDVNRTGPIKKAGRCPVMLHQRPPTNCVGSGSEGIWMDNGGEPALETQPRLLLRAEVPVVR
ncbi:MAG: hypothetical protein M3461_07450 [Pseudomonadota bacterium]|nr:hypothetical protein [Pseudomonadota bacterium]